MAQHNNVAESVRSYTRTDFAALRFKLTKIDGQAIMGLYSEDELLRRGVSTVTQLSAWLDDLRDHLVERARLANPKVSHILEDARNRNIWSKSVMEFIIQAGEKDKATPKLSDGISVWFRPIVFKTLAAEGLHTLGDLKAYMETRGTGWFRPIPRLGPGKARALEKWFVSQADSLGLLKLVPDRPQMGLVTLNPDASTRILPLDRISTVVTQFDGSQGLNRGHQYCLISARNDLEAVHAYLYRFRGKDKTHRAYRKELERFLLWCVCRRRIAMSSVLTDDCEAYKDFLASPDADWTGIKVPRKSARWRPFQGALSPESQRYATQVIRTFFEWLMRVRYLGGNPWATVSDPAVEEKELEMAIDKALPVNLWSSLIEEQGILDKACAAYGQSTLETPRALRPKEAVTPGAQYRLARAIILLMGSTGIRREEATSATRDRLKPVREQAGKVNGLWELAVLGKRRKWRTVYLPVRVVEAIRAHWLDRGHDFNDNASPLPLLSPVTIPNTPAAQAKHFPLGVSNELPGASFSPDGIYKVTKSALKRLASDMQTPLSDEERSLLVRAAPHALRHTFATHAAAKAMPIDVLQRLLGHTSQQTTSIYVQAERARGIDEVSKFFGG